MIDITDVFLASDTNYVSKTSVCGTTWRETLLGIMKWARITTNKVIFHEFNDWCSTPMSLISSCYVDVFFGL